MDPLTRAEWEVMKVVWKRGEVVARDVTRALARRRGWARNTVRTLLGRLAEKGYVVRRRIGPVDLFAPRVQRTAAVGKAIDDFVESVLDGAVAPFVTHLIQRRDIDPAELHALRQALVRKERKKP